MKDEKVRKRSEFLRDGIIKEEGRGSEVRYSEEGRRRLGQLKTSSTAKILGPLRRGRRRRGQLRKASEDGGQRRTPRKSPRKTLLGAPRGCDRPRNAGNWVTQVGVRK